MEIRESESGGGEIGSDGLGQVGHGAEAPMGIPLEPEACRRRRRHTEEEEEASEEEEVEEEVVFTRDNRGGGEGPHS